MKPKQPKVKIVPQLLATRADMELAFSELRSAVIERDRLASEREAQLDAATLAINLKFEAKISACNTAVAQHAANLTRWAISNRPAFGKLRSLETASGFLRFRTGTPKLKLLVKSWEKVIEKIKGFGLKELYLRTVEEVNKEALLADRDSEMLVRARQISLADLGVRAVQEEHFSIEVKREETPEPQIVVDEALDLSAEVKA